MPEGPEVKSIADELNHLIRDYPDLISLDYDQGSRYDRKPLLHREEFNALLPRKIICLRTKGKKLIFDLGGIYLISSLGMEGRWTKNPGRHSNLWLSFGSVFKSNRLLVKVMEERLYFDDSRHFGEMIICLSDSELQSHLINVGPDLLAEEISREKWLEIFRGKSLQNKEITAMLLEQKLVSGIGNYLRAEILYRSKINPGRLIGDLSDEELERLRIIAHQIIKYSYLSKGCTIRSFWNLSGQAGKFQCQVYNHKKDPQGNSVVQTKFKDGRTTWWVPSVQK